MPKKKPTTDHLGNTFESFADMAYHYRLKKFNVYGRLKNGWSLEKALTTPVRDHNQHIVAKCDLAGISITKYSNRKRKGYPKELWFDSKNINSIESVDHLGNKFKSFAKMCKFHHQKTGTVRKRLKTGLSLKQALTLKTKYTKKCTKES